MWEELTTYCDLCGLSCKPPQSSTSLIWRENNTECVYVWETCAGWERASLPLASSLRQRWLDVLKSRGRQQFESVCTSAGFFFFFKKKEIKGGDALKKAKSARKWKEKQRERERERGSQSSGMLWLWVTTQLLPNPISDKYWWFEALLQGCQLKQWDQSEITQQPIKKQLSGFWGLNFE